MNSRGCQPTVGRSRKVRPLRGRRFFGLVPWADAHGYSDFVPPGQSGTVCLRLRPQHDEVVFRLDSFGVAEYVGLHDVGSSVINCYLGSTSHNLWLRLSASLFGTHAHLGEQTPL